MYNVQHTALTLLYSLTSLFFSTFTKWSIFIYHFYLEYIVLPKVENMNIENLLEIDKNRIRVALCFCSSSERETNVKPLQDMLLAEPELSQLGRQDILLPLFIILLSTD